MMVGHRNLSKSFAIMAALLMALCAFAAFTADSSEAATNATNPVVHVGSFTEEETGRITITIDDCDEGEIIEVTVKDGDKVKVDAKEFTAVDGTNTVSVKFKLSEGTHNEIYITVAVSDTEILSDQLTIECKDNIWTHFSAYAVIVVLIIVVVIIAVVYMRARPNNKPTTTFTQLEQERKAAALAKDQPAAPAKTEKVKYSSSRRK